MLETASLSYGPESQYLIKNLGPVLRDCIADVVKKRPKDPIEHLAHCLHRHAEVAELVLRAYIGQTARKLHIRICEHKRRINKLPRNAEEYQMLVKDSVMAVHALDTEHRIDMDNVEVLRRGLRFTPLITEAVEIIKHHSVNRIEGVELEKLEAEALQDADRARQQYLEEGKNNETLLMEASVSEDQQIDLLSAEPKFSASDLSGSGEVERTADSNEMNVDNADEPSVNVRLSGWLFRHIMKVIVYNETHVQVDDLIMVTNVGLSGIDPRMKKTNKTQGLGKGDLIYWLITNNEQRDYSYSYREQLKAYLQQAFFALDLLAIGTDLTFLYGIKEYIMLISARPAAALHKLHKLQQKLTAQLMPTQPSSDEIFVDYYLPVNDAKPLDAYENLENFGRFAPNRV
ncbi:hypothetical protein CLF_100948 [Clonorchis sinensis]|uniref:Uncharacterized protein n=1 Tax=Clonorchis sinensis TaxID=79923 RepID=G7Y4L8_CLOSI|nr:hypothetical protein CLF_100948 [Clonorchis sinensis]